MYKFHVERNILATSPTTDFLRSSLAKINVSFDKRRLSRAKLSEFNIAQLQILVNDILTKIESLNEQLVELLMQKDDLHMEQDSMLVDVEDMQGYLYAKQNTTSILIN